MKKILLVFITFFIVFVSLVDVNAINAKEQYYFETVIETETITKTYATGSKTASKTLYVKNASDQVLWYVKVTGTFTYTGSSSTCTSSSVTAEAYDTNWKIISKSSSKSGKTANAIAKGGMYRNGLIIETLTKNVSLTCDANGNLS